MAQHWFTDQEQVVGFAQVLRNATTDVDDPDGMLEYFEKPYKWDDEHTAWMQAGAPQDDSFEGWDKFLEWLDTHDR